MLALSLLIATACVQEPDPDSLPYPVYSYESLVLPHVFTGEPERAYAPPGEIRFAINVLIDGRVIVERKTVCDSSMDDEERRMVLRQTFAYISRHMEMTAATGGQGGPMFPAEAILIRADLNAPFSVSQEILATCLLEGIDITQIEFAVANAREPEFDKETGLVPTDQPRQIFPIVLPADRSEWGAPKPVEASDKNAVTITLRVEKAGQKLELLRSEKIPWKGDGRFRYDLGTREVEYKIAGRSVASFARFREVLNGMGSVISGRIFVVDAGPGVSTAEALLVADTGRLLGASEVRFAVPTEK